MIASRPMPIHRSWLRTVGWILTMLVLLGLAAFMGLSGNYFMAGILALFGFLAMTGVGSGSCITACPVCGTELGGLFGLKRCPRCLSYGQVSQGQYYELAPDFVTKVPLLALPLGERRDMPPLCCACGAAGCAQRKITHHPSGICLRPRCSALQLHAGGADLDSEIISGKGKPQSARAESEVVCLLPRLPENELSIPGKPVFQTAYRLAGRESIAQCLLDVIDLKEANMPSNINGFGTKYYGQRDFRPDGSYVTTNFFCLGFFPVVPLHSSAYR